MTKLSLLLLSLLSLPTLSLARVGETLAECETRYGPVVERVPARLPESDKEAFIFSKEGVTIQAEMQNGAVWQITYTVRELSDETADYFLKVNAQAGGWSTPTLIKGDKIYTTESRSHFAVYTPADFKFKSAGKVSVCTRAYSKANRADYDARLLTVRDKLNTREGTTKLKGF